MMGYIFYHDKAMIALFCNFPHLCAAYQYCLQEVDFNICIKTILRNLDDVVEFIGKSVQLPNR